MNSGIGMKDPLNKRMIGSAFLLACLFLAADEWLLFHRIFF